MKIMSIVLRPSLKPHRDSGRTVSATRIRRCRSITRARTFQQLTTVICRDYYHILPCLLLAWIWWLCYYSESTGRSHSPCS